jgi:hypothetical protein
MAIERTFYREGRVEPAVSINLTMRRAGGVHLLMRKFSMFAVVLGIALATASPALAQRLPFERTFELSEPSVLDVSTIRGKIDITVGERGRIVIGGDVTVRVDWDVPANAVDLARRVAASPPIERDGKTLRLRPPSGAAERRAVTVSYRVQVPPDTELLAVSDSGATSVGGVSGPVVVRTESGAIELTRLGGTAGVTSGSGSVIVDGIAGDLTVTTRSSAFTGRSLSGGLRVRTSSGAVDAALVGAGDVDVQTSSSAIRLRGVRSALTAVTQSGRILLEGLPGRPWTISTGSGSVEVAVERSASFTVDATSRSGSIKVAGAPVQGTVSKRKIAGTVAGGGPLVRVNSRSGSVGITVAAPGAVRGHASPGNWRKTVDSMLVQTGPERDTKVDDEQPQQDRRGCN